MERLIKGIKRFQQGHYKKEEEFFRGLAKGQSPDVLFFACSDSRVDPNLITQSNAGELFIVKNVGNIIPENNPQWNNSCTAAAIEFAIHVLKVTDIVVCGHSDCGALKALYYGERDFEQMPNLRNWISTVNSVKEFVTRNSHDKSQKAIVEMTEKGHILTQLGHLMSYPIVSEAVLAEKLSIHGWYYDIGSGSVFAYNSFNETFEKINSNEKGEKIARPHVRDYWGDL